VNPKATARAAGLAYLVIFLIGPFSALAVRGSAIVRNDSAATAANLLAAEPWWLLAFTAELVNATADTIVALLLYVLLRPVGRTVSLLGAAFQLVMVALLCVKALFHLLPLILLKAGDTFLTSFSAGQLQDLSYLSLRMYGETYDVMLFLFGIHCVLVGWLIARATFMPRIFGWLMVFAGLCYILNTIAAVHTPEFRRMLYPWILLPALPAEGGLTLWLLIKGVNAEKWRAQAAVAEARAWIPVQQRVSRGSRTCSSCCWRRSRRCTCAPALLYAAIPPPRLRTFWRRSRCGVWPSPPNW
jgi:hypothetical protein